MTECKYSSLRKEDLFTSVEERLIEIRENSRSIEGLITRYILNTSTIIDSERLKRVTFGERDKSKPHKTILLVGETGAGKSTIINAMINYMLGVSSEDRVWYEIIETKYQTDSQTNAVTVYDVFIENSPFSLTVIDTPGFGNTDGLEEDVKIAESLHELFRSNDGVCEIDAVCLVVTSITTRLTERQLYVFNAVLSLFGCDVENNIVVFITHAARKPNNAIETIKESKFLCAQNDKGEPVYFRFDNFHCQNFNDEEMLEDYQASSTLLNTTMESFMTFLTENKAISTDKTETVLKNRIQLTASVSKITQIERKINEQTNLQQYKVDQRDTNFEYEVDEFYKEKVPLEYKWWHFGWKEATCCSVCKENCHYPGCWWVRDLSWCSVMSEGKCTVCTGRCHYTKHVKEDKIYEVKTRKINEDLKRKYEKESEETKSLISQLENEIKEQEEEKKLLLEECYECVITLDEIALKRESVSILQHLDFLIEKVMEPKRVQKLQELKKRAEAENQHLLGFIRLGNQ